MKNGKKWNMENIVKGFTRGCPDFSLGIPLDKSRLLLSSEYSGVEVRLYSYIHSSYLICVCMGHTKRFKNRKGTIQSKFYKKISGVYNFIGDNAGHPFGSWIFNKIDFDKQNITSDFPSSVLGYFIAHLTLKNTLDSCAKYGIHQTAQHS